MKSTDKKLVIGVDEAGYGPNLGPLLIAATAWASPKNLSEAEFIAAFSPLFGQSASHPPEAFIPLADSKKLYQPGKGLKNLEQGVLCLLAMADSIPENLESLICQHCVEPIPIQAADEDAGVPWYNALHRSAVPTQSADTLNVSELAKLGSAHLHKSDVEILSVKGQVVREDEFNRQVRHLGSKGQLLSIQTLRLVAELVSEADQFDECEVYCDRQGGRRNYLPVLAEVFPDEWFIETATNKTRCSYVTQGSPRLTIHFSVGGDNFPATAGASMFAKYLRERLMGSFNAFWQKKLPDLKPTAGYPVDAKRFRLAIEPVARQLQLSEDEWWRCR